MVCRVRDVSDRVRDYAAGTEESFDSWVQHGRDGEQRWTAVHRVAHGLPCPRPVCVRSPVRQAADSQRERWRVFPSQSSRHRRAQHSSRSLGVLTTAGAGQQPLRHANAVEEVIFYLTIYFDPSDWGQRQTRRGAWSSCLVRVSRWLCRSSVGCCTWQTKRALPGTNGCSSRGGRRKRSAR